MSEKIPQMLTAREVCGALRISLATLYRAVSTGRLPKPVKIGERATRWRAGDLAEFIDGLGKPGKGRPE